MAGRYVVWCDACECESSCVYRCEFCGSDLAEKTAEVAGRFQR